MSSLVQKAKKLRAYIEQIVASLNDNEALDAKELFPVWQIDTNYAVNDRVRDNNILYKCAQAHTSQELWQPSSTPALWIAVSISDGTITNPIMAVSGMEYEKDKYYLDPVDNNIYLCTSSAVLHYMPHELIDLYFVKI